MISTENTEKMVAVTVFGEFTLADYKEFEDVVNYHIQFEGQVDLLFDLRQMAGFTLDVAWEEIKFSRQHAGDFRRIAVLTEDQWLTWSAWVSQLFVTADVRVFDDEDEARAWLAAEPDDDLRIELHAVPPLPLHALAMSSGLSAYDAAYLSVAAELQAPLSTLDQRLAQAAQRHLGKTD